LIKYDCNMVSYFRINGTYVTGHEWIYLFFFRQWEHPDLRLQCSVSVKDSIHQLIMSLSELSANGGQ
jgi:hypothetical protein